MNAQAEQGKKLEDKQLARQSLCWKLRFEGNELGNAFLVAPILVYA